MIIRHKVLWGLFIALLLTQAGLWLSVRDSRAQWNNVPPAVSKGAMSAATLGDEQMSYRLAAMMLQNMGNTGGRTIKFEEYDYERLMKWFTRVYELDPRSNVLPLLAAYYYSATPDPQQLRRVIDFLEIAGNSAEGQKWRWLAQAVYLARFRLNNQDLALRLAQKLAAIDNPAMPGWTRRMPAFILSDLGQEQAAYALLLQVLKSGGGKMEASEVNETIYYICTRLLKPEEAANNDLCIKNPLLKNN